eukprot:COSAG01_NODE_30_length_36127_cov_41.433234_14_plen_125_part_00
MRAGAQEDMAATLLAFSYNVLVGIELVTGRPLAPAEQADYIALWRYIGWLLGVESTELDPCASPAHAKATLESVRGAHHPPPVSVRVRVEIMGSPKCMIVGKSQPVLCYDRSHYLHPHPYIPAS